MKTKNILYAFVIVFLTFGRHFFIFGQSKNYFYLMPSQTEVVRIFIMLLFLIASIGIILYLFESKNPELHSKILTALFLISLLPLLDLLAFNAGMAPGRKGIIRIIYPLFCLLYIPVIIIISIRCPLIKNTKRIFPVLLLLALISFYYSIPKGFANSRIDNNFRFEENTTPIHLIIFDATSYELVNDPERKDSFANFNKFASQSYTFYDAHSPGCSTLVSIPKIITGEQYVDYKEHNLSFLVKYSDKNEFEEIDVQGSVFDSLKHYGYHNILIGGYLPYNDIFGESLTFGVQYRSFPMFAYLPPWPIYKILDLSVLKRVIFYNEFNDYAEQIKKCPDNSFFFVHFLIPHWPNIFDEDGPSHWYWSNLLKGEKYKFSERNGAQTVYADRKFGEIIDLMKDKVKYDKSLIILTSDHNVDRSPDRSLVPLWIKTPYQTEQIIVSENCNTININAFLSDYARNNKVDITKLYCDN